MSRASRASRDDRNWFPTLFVACFLLLASGWLPAEELAGRVQSAIVRSLPLLQASAESYTTQRACFSCHHQGLAVLAVTSAKSRGFSIDAERVREQSRFTHAYFTERREQVAVGNGVPGGAYSTGYALLSLARDHWQPDATTDALVDYLFHTQDDNGRWPILTHRPPLEDSDFTATALSIRALQLYARKEREGEAEKRIANARTWLIETQPETTEDKAFAVLGLRWSGAAVKRIDRVTAQLLSEQRQDGGWAQLSDLESDTYATGQVLVAIHLGGRIAASDDAYRRGMRFLLRTQEKDGSWKVVTRSKPIQTYFESDFPHGKSQFISVCGTSWATMALTLAVNSVRKQRL